ncbi:hypothetical protein ACWCOZ_34115, partial [Streptomyces sp. NPDC001840]
KTRAYEVSVLPAGIIAVVSTTLSCSAGRDVSSPGPGGAGPERSGPGGPSLSDPPRRGPG